MNNTCTILNLVVIFYLRVLNVNKRKKPKINKVNVNILYDNYIRISVDE